MLFRSKYFDKVCHQQTSSACLIASYLNDNSEKDKLENVDTNLWVGKVLLVDEKYAQRDFLSSIELIEDLQKEPALKTALEKKYVRSVWALRDTGKGASGRRPASTSTKSKIEDFKEKYGIQ